MPALLGASDIEDFRITIMKNEKNLDWVQLLRGLAALLVVLCHARYAFLGGAGWPLAEQLLRPGAAGVDLFFILSGFIICYSTAGNDGSPAYVARFAIKRFSRVWPVYAVVVLLFVLLECGGISYLQNPGGRSALWRTLAMVPVDPRSAPYFGLTLPLGWTLEFEMYFYFLFAVALLFRRLRWFVLLSWVLLTVILLPLGTRGFDMNVATDLHYSVGYMSIVSNSLVLEFLFGVAIGWIYLSDRVRLRSRAVAWQLLLLGVAFAVGAIYGDLTHIHGPRDWGWPLALMVLCMALASKTVDIAVPPLFLWLGRISYSLYLTHLLAQGLLSRWLKHAGLEPATHTWTYVFMSTCMALSLAALSHHYLEQRLANAVRRRLLQLLPAQRAEPPQQAAEAPRPVHAVGRA
jgi:exopolysaccharide production protein ExoZ